MLYAGLSFYEQANGDYKPMHTDFVVKKRNVEGNSEWFEFVPKCAEPCISWYFCGHDNGYWVELNGEQIHYSNDVFDRDLFIAKLKLSLPKCQES